MSVGVTIDSSYHERCVGSSGSIFPASKVGISLLEQTGWLIQQRVISSQFRS